MGSTESLYLVFKPIEMRINFWDFIIDKFQRALENVIEKILIGKNPVNFQNPCQLMI